MQDDRDAATGALTEVRPDGDRLGPSPMSGSNQLAGTGLAELGTGRPDGPTMAGMKLVRDRIPEIIRANGQQAVVHVADPGEFRTLLRLKLTEEVEEFLQSSSLEELADVLEVVYSLARDLGADDEGLEGLRRQKADARGGFARRIVWHGPAG